MAAELVVVQAIRAIGEHYDGKGCFCDRQNPLRGFHGRSRDESVIPLLP